MTDPAQRQIEEIFLEAAEVEPVSRCTFLDERCADLPPTVRVEVEKLLDADQRQSKLNADEVNPHLSFANMLPAQPDEASDELGQNIGPYKLLEKLGEGGMGVVFMAEQRRPVHRRVAMKLIKSGLDSKEIVARFEAERQALALMDHPNIAKVLDVGTTDKGRPYFVMELVKGVPITEYCDQKRLGALQRLTVFTSVCQAVAHAHQKGVIHRDIKPSNVLVAEYDDELVPKVIDFGVAKATTQKLTDKTAFTRFGQLVGTFEYMSPEQAKLNQLDVDTRSDVYSLGVLLYELMTGTTPFDRSRLRAAALDEMIRIICEEDPPRPSTQLTNHSGDLPVDTKKGSRSPAALRTIHNELDWIVMKSLEKERRRRYQSAADLADDIRRLIKGDAVEACPPTIRYRATKFVRRHKTPVSVAAASVVLLVVSSLVGWSLYRATKQRYDLAAQKIRANERSALLASRAGVLANSDPIQGTQLAIEAVETTFRHDESVLPSVQQTLMNAVASLGDTYVTSGYLYRSSATFSRDDRWLVTAGDGESNPTLWDLQSEPVTQRAFSHKEASFAVVTSDGRWLLTAKNRVLLWDLNQQSPDGLELANGEVHSLVVSEDGRWAVAAFYDGHVQAWDLHDEDPMLATRLLAGHRGSEMNHRYSASISSTGLLATASIDGTVLVWDLQAGSESHVMEFRHDKVNHVVISKDGRWLVTASDRARLWDLSAVDPNESAVWLSEQRGVSVLAISRDGKHLAVAGGSGCCIYDLTVPNPRASRLVLHGQRGGVSLVAISEGDRPTIITGGWDGTVRVWDLDVPHLDRLPTVSEYAGVVTKHWSPDVTPTGTRLLLGHKKYIVDMDVSSDSTRLVTVDASGHIRLWNLTTENASGSYIAESVGVTQAVGISPDGKWLVDGRRGPNSQIWRIDDQHGLTSAMKLQGAADGIGKFVISPDSRWLITTSAVRIYTDESGHARNENVAHVWDLKSVAPGAVAFRLEGHDGAVTSIAIDGSSRQVVTGGMDMTVRVWDVSNGRGSQTHLLQGHTSKLNSVAISLDGSIVATAGRDGKVLVWDLSQDPTNAIALVGHNEHIHQIAISPDNRWIATGGSREDSLVWDLKAPHESRIIPGGPWSGHFVTRVAFSLDGRWFATGSWDRSTIVFDMNRDDPFKEPFRVIENMSAVGSLAFSLDSSRLISGSADLPRVIDLNDKSGTTIELPVNDVTSVALTPDGKRAITASGNKVGVWILDTADLIKTAKRLIKSP